MAKFTDAVVASIKALFETGDTPSQADFETWIDAIQAGIEEHDHAGAGDGDAGRVPASGISNRTRTFFVPVTMGYDITAGANLSMYAYGYGWPLADGTRSIVNAFFKVPADYSSAMTIKPLICALAGSAGNLRVSSNALYGADAEDYNEHGGASTTDTVSAPATNAAQALLATESIAYIAADDFVRLYFERIGADALDTSTEDVYMAGWEVSYTADS